jgi:hypothetical protein
MENLCLLPTELESLLRDLDARTRALPPAWNLIIGVLRQKSIADSLNRNPLDQLVNAKDALERCGRRLTNDLADYVANELTHAKGCIRDCLASATTELTAEDRAALSAAIKKLENFTLVETP